jgi:hypothetical protein
MVQTMPEIFTTGSDEEAYLPIESYFGNVGRTHADHIFLSRNLATKFGAQHFTIVAVDKAIPHYANTISDHRPVMIRLHIATGLEEGVGFAGIPTPDWLRL